MFIFFSCFVCLSTNLFFAFEPMALSNFLSRRSMASLNFSIFVDALSSGRLYNSSAVSTNDSVDSIALLSLSLASSLHWPGWITPHGFPCRRDYIFYLLNNFGNFMYKKEIGIIQSLFFTTQIWPNTIKKININQLLNSMNIFVVFSFSHICFLLSLSTTILTLLIVQINNYFLKITTVTPSYLKIQSENLIVILDFSWLFIELSASSIKP